MIEENIGRIAMPEAGKKLTTFQRANMERARRELSRRHVLDFRKLFSDSFRENWHHKLICDKLEEVVAGKCLRLIICMPPRSGKSHLVSEALPAWFLGKNPNKNVIASSYGTDLAEHFGRKVRDLMLSQKFGLVFPASKVRRGMSSVTKFQTINGGEYTAIGVGGSLTGKGGHLLILDDPIKNAEEALSKHQRDKKWDWFTSTFFTRKMPGAAVVVMATRWHEDDIIGRLIAQGGWELLSLPEIATEDEEHRKAGELLWPDWFTAAEVEEARSTLGPFYFSALYQQSPISEETQEFKASDFQWCEPHEATTGVCYCAVDTAVGEHDHSDYTGFAVVHISESNVWKVRSWREKLNSKALVDRLFEIDKMYNPRKIGIEKTAYESAVKPFLKEKMIERNHFFKVESLSHGGVAKEMRIRGLIPRYETKSIFHVRGFCADLEAELLSFPGSKHDDASDALAYIQLMSGGPKFSFRITAQQFSEKQKLPDSAKSDIINSGFTQQEIKIADSKASEEGEKKRKLIFG